MHKKGITEEVAKKRSRKTVKHQRGIVGADLASILAKRNAKPEVRNAARQAAITKAKDAKKAKETTKKSKVRFFVMDSNACVWVLILRFIKTARRYHHRPQGLQATDEGRQDWWSLSVVQS